MEGGTPCGWASPLVSNSRQTSDPALGVSGVSPDEREEKIRIPSEIRILVGKLCPSGIVLERFKAK